ncbi:Terpene synthase [Macleaya cordata]|uniref:Terpene synthase n=1 Tax=Macleaya cordata TaxID=56857 RepID=A0A200QQ29_MACCD|nr:Terpene synthase [Macleaya cordata]
MELVNMIRTMLNSMDDGEISISAYDTAWVALVEDVNGSGTPQFPSSLQWIVKNQLPDGSWGDRYIFLAHDRIINTLACVIALKKWNVYHDRCEKGMSFIWENILKLEDENAEHMPIGFEVVFPSLIEIARSLSLEVPDDSHPVILNLNTQRNLKLTRIPKEMMHLVPTTLLHSLEGMPGLSWEKLLKLQCSDGSFLFSPSSTAFALMKTKDQNCLTYLHKAVKKFNGGVPNVYPVDLFEHIWVVDRLERLGISRYFQSEIEESLNYVSRYWTEDGICWARNSRVQDIDDTAMGFRLLRLHGHNVSADVFRCFEKDGEFFCFAGQANQAITGIFNLYRASQVSFPGENILKEAKAFSSNFLRESQASNKVVDKWIITKDLPGEVAYALDVPWYASLPRIEMRFYIEHYGGEEDVWIGKTLYRMPYVNNNAYLELAKLDFNNCQALHKLEWVGIQKWYRDCSLRDIGLSRSTLLQAYFLATASIFEPKRSTERLAWTKTMLLIDAVSSYFMKNSSDQKRRAFVDDFINSSSRSSSIYDENYSHPQREYISKKRMKKKRDGVIVEALVETLNCISLDVLMAHQTDVSHHLRRSWETWMRTWEWGKDKHHREAELLVRTITICAGQTLSEEALSSPHFVRLTHLTNRLCHNLRLIWSSKSKQVIYPEEVVYADNMIITSGQVESDMEELVYCVLIGCDGDGDGVDRETREIFLSVAKCFYYSAHCTQATVNHHIAKVLFETIS